MAKAELSQPLHMSRNSSEKSYRFFIQLPLFLPVIIILPIIAGLLGTVFPAFGIYPALGGTQFSLDYIVHFFDLPNMAEVMGRTAFLGLLAGFSSCFIALIITSVIATSPRLFNWLRRFASPMLSIPHATVALGLLFFLTPSGLIFRLLSEFLFHWPYPIDIATAPDPYGIGFIVALMMKEVPFLLLVIIAAMAQKPVKSLLMSANAMGLSKSQAWFKVIIPVIYPLIRLPIYVVIAYSLSAIEAAYVLLPASKPTLSILIIQWIQDPNLNQAYLAAVAALVQSALVIAGLGLWFTVELLLKSYGKGWICNGQPGYHLNWIIKPFVLCILALLLLTLFAIFTLALWSVIGRWSWPNIWPESYSLQNFTTHSSLLLNLIKDTIFIAVLAIILSLVFTLALLERAACLKKSPDKIISLALITLLLPQPIYLIGINVGLASLNIDGHILTVILLHMLYILPYCLMALRGPYLSLDQRIFHSAAALGTNPWRCFIRLKMPMLLRPILVAAAIGLSVSLALYLPTLIAGAGRISTLTVEALSLSSGQDRRLIGLVAIFQIIIPAIGFILAAIIPLYKHRHRKGVQAYE